MKRAVRFDFSDRSLGRAVALMLEGAGFLQSDDTDAPLITDIPELAEGATALLISRDECGGEGALLRRPFAEEELFSAVEGLLGAEPREARSGIRIDKKRSCVYIDGSRIPLTEKEMRLLSLLVQCRGRAVSDSEIVERVFDGETAEGSNIAAVYINYLRKKLDQALDKKLILRVRGQGYMLK